MASIVPQTPFNEYTGNGVSTVYGFEFQVFAATDFEAKIDGVTVPSSDYTLSGIGLQAGGTCTFDTAPATGAEILLSMVIALSRDTDYQENGDLLAATLDRDFNRLWQALQIGDAKTGGALRLPYPEQAVELPAIADRGGKLLSFNSTTGAPEMVAPVEGTATALALQLADTSSASNGDALMGVKLSDADSEATTQHAVNEDVAFDVVRFGADKSGATDSYADILKAVKAAITRRAATGADAITVWFPDGKYTITQGLPLVTGIRYACRARHSVKLVCTGTTAVVYTATHSAGVLTDNLNATITQIQDGSKAVENSGIINIYCESTGAISGTAPSGSAWASVVQIVGAPSMLLDNVGAESTSNGINGISLKFCWRAKVRNPWTPRGSAYSGGKGLLVEDESNAVLVSDPFCFGRWDVGIDLGANANTLMCANIEQASATGNIGLRLSGNGHQVFGGYYEGSKVDIQLGIAGSPCNRVGLYNTWHNGSGTDYAINILAAVNCQIHRPYFTGSFAVSRFKTTSASTECYGNDIHVDVADASAPNLAGLGLIGGRNRVHCYGEDNDDHRFFAIYNSGDGSPLETQLNQRGAQFCCFEVWLQNDGGTLKVAVTDGDEAATTYDTCFAAISSALIAQADVSAGSAFAANVPASRFSGTNSRIILNTSAQVTGEQAFIAGNVRTNNGTALSVELRFKTIDIGGVTRTRPEFILRNAATGAAFDFDTTNFTAGEFLKVPIIGFLK
jgi:hypothetical protein